MRPQSPTSPAAGDVVAAGEVNSHEVGNRQQDVWVELFGLVHGLGDTVGLALQAFTPTDDKAVSATTKKRLALRSIQGLKQSQASVEALLEHLKALQSASQTWQRSMMFASKSHQELMEQIESTTQELRTTSERLRAVEAQRLAAVHDAEALRARTAQQEAMIKELQSALKAREEELETLQFTVHEVQADASQTKQGVEQLREAAAQAQERAASATMALDEARSEAAKAQGLAERHQQVVAKLTADNLVFLMQLKKAEADLAAANQERAQLRLAAERQRGPWFDQVRAGVEERVRQAMQRSEELEAQIERRKAEHASQTQAMEAQQMQLEDQLVAARLRADDLEGRLASALESQQRADSRCAAADAAAAELRQRVDDLAAENRVLQESVRGMRQECTEHWVSEQAAVGRVSGLEERIQQLEQALEQQAARAAALQQQLDVQAGVNRQLMARKSEVEWQLMAAMAKLDGGSTDGPVPLNLHVSGMLQVGGSDKRAAEVPPAPSDAPVPRSLQAASSSKAAAAGPGPQPPMEPATEILRFSEGSAAPAASHPVGGPMDATDSALVGAVFAAQFHHSQLEQVANMQRHADHAGMHSDGEPKHADGDAPAERVGGLQEQQDPLHAEPSLASPLPASGEPAAEQSAGRGHAVMEAAADAGPGGGSAIRQGVAQTSHIAGRAPPDPALEGFGLGSTSYPAPSGNGTGASDTNARWAFPFDASTAISSPPSSVVVSTEPGSPTAEVPRVSLPAAAIARAAAVTIRTGPVSPFGARGRGGAADSQLRPAQGPTQGATGSAGAMGRRGSLHDGGDVWVADDASSVSSDDSDFLFAGGVVVQREAGGRRGEGRPPPHHQAQLRQLQQELEEMVESARPRSDPQSGARHGVTQLGEAAGGSAQQAQKVSGLPVSSQDDFIYTRQFQPQASSSSSQTRPGIVMRTGPSAPASRASAGVGNSGGGPFAREDSGSGMFSILKSGTSLPSARAGGASPIHPAFAGAGAGPTASPRRTAGEAQAQSPAALHPAPDAGQVGYHATTATAIQPPLPAHVQAGPPYYATGSALSGEAVESFVRWSASSYTAPRSTPEAGPSIAWGLSIAAPVPLQAQAPFSPARSSTPVRSPRSPPHPAFVVRDDCTPLEVCTSQSSPRPLAAIASKPAAGAGAEAADASGIQPQQALQFSVPIVGDAAKSAGALGVAAGRVADLDLAAGASAAAYARSRIAVHSLVLGGRDGAPAGGGGNHGEGARLVSSLRASSSSSASSSGLCRNGAATGLPHLHKPSSSKSVRFSNDGPEELHQQAAAQATYNRQRSASQSLGPVAEAHAEQRTGSPSSTARQTLYRPAGSVQHPAIMARPNVGTIDTAGGGADELEPLSAKRYSAVASVTAVPRPSMLS